MRRAEIRRETGETKIEVGIDLDGTGRADVATGVGLLDNKVPLLARHSMIDLLVRAEGDLHVDDHHTVEDVGIALGQAFAKALGDKKGITRYADCLMPMDETLSRLALDISGRPYLVWNVALAMPRLGEWDTELIEHWFHSVAQSAGLTLHVELLYGSNNHHICESIYKGFARAMRSAVERDPRKAGAIPSTKGQLGG
jgi:imidazoleglycerol-phosphate dehydratase